MSNLTTFASVSLAAAIFLPAFQPSAHANTGDSVLVYNSFGSGDSYSSIRWIVGGTSSTHGYQGHAEYFVPDISGYLSQIQVATIDEAGGSPLSNFFIAQDNGSGIPGSILESFDNVSVPNGLLTINSVATPLLQAGQTYWLCDEPANANTYTGWYENNVGVTGDDAIETQGSWTWINAAAEDNTDSVFSISVVPVPEPSMAGLILLGAVLLAGRRYRLRKESI
jgi:hypothetical protein